MQAAKTYAPRKLSTVETIAELAKSRKVIVACKLHKVRAAQLMALRKNFRDQIRILVAKNRIANLAFDKSGRKDVEEFMKNLEGQNALIFTDMDPFRLFILLEKNKVNLPARAGDMATDDVTIPAGNTGIPPGPVLSEFKEAGVPTRIDTGSIWVCKDTVVLRKGDVITPKMAGLLSRLGIKPIKAGLSVLMAYVDGRVLYEKDIRIDLDEFRSMIAEAQRLSFSLALEASYAARETLPILVTMAVKKALSLAIATKYITKETAPIILSETVTQASRLYYVAKEKGYS